MGEHYYFYDYYYYYCHSRGDKKMRKQLGTRETNCGCWPDFFFRGTSWQFYPIAAV